MHLPFWLTTALLFPLIAYQGRRVRRTTPRLPEASGPASGQYGQGQPVTSLLVIGESTAAGVGAHVLAGVILFLGYRLRKQGPGLVEMAGSL